MTFANISSLRRHQKIIHEDSKEFKFKVFLLSVGMINIKTFLLLFTKCTADNYQCSSEFKTVHALNRHLRDYHNFDPPKAHQCPKCSKYFTYSSQLERHVKKHEKTYVCEKCTDSKVEFTRWSDLLKHRAENHSLECETCKALSKHKVFKTKKGLRNHIARKHSNIERPVHEHKCIYCEFSFTKLYDLTQHVNIKHDFQRFFCYVNGCKSSYQSKVIL